MKLRLGIACGVLALCAAGQPAHAQNPEWLGCYQVNRDGWGWTTENEDSTQFEPPEVLQLLPTTQAQWPGGLEVRPPIMSYRTARGRWEARGPDSLSLLWSNGFTGIRINVARAGDSLIGVVTAFTDNGPMYFATARVVMKPTSCDRMKGGGGSHDSSAEQKAKPEDHGR